MSRFVVLGATGHIGSAVVQSLVEAGESAIAIVRSREHAHRIAGPSVEIRIVDAMDSEGLHKIFREAKRAFLLNPPADPSFDTDAREMATAKSIANAVNGSGLEKVVVVSTYGAQLGEKIGDLSVLYEFEQMIEAAGVPCAINRGAYYLTNLDSLLEPARNGMITSPYPAGLKMPMVAPLDLGRAAARRLMSPVTDIGIHYVEGPQRYSFWDVAQSFSSVLSRPVELQRIPRDEIESSFRKLGFSLEAAQAYARMTKVTMDRGFDTPDNVERCVTSLWDYITMLVQRASRL